MESKNFIKVWIKEVINNIEYWKNAPLCTRKKINLATKEWMKYLR